MTAHWQGGNGGKGSKPRPFSVSQEEYDNRFEAIFGKKKAKAFEHCADCVDPDACLTMCAISNAINEDVAKHRGEE